MFLPSDYSPARPPLRRLSSQNSQVFEAVNMKDKIDSEYQNVLGSDYSKIKDDLIKKRIDLIKIEHIFEHNNTVREQIQ